MIYHLPLSSVPNAYKRNAELFAGSKIPETISDVNGSAQTISGGLRIKFHYFGD